MAMGTRRDRSRQDDMWIAQAELAKAPGHAFYDKLNELLEANGFDEFAEGLCARFYHAKLGRPSLTPGIYFRSLLIGYFEGIQGERGIAWRLADSLEDAGCHDWQVLGHLRGPGPHVRGCWAVDLILGKG